MMKPKSAELISLWRIKFEFSCFTLDLVFHKWLVPIKWWNSINLGELFRTQRLYNFDLRFSAFGKCHRTTKTRTQAVGYLCSRLQPLLWDGIVALDEWVICESKRFITRSAVLGTMGELGHVTCKLSVRFDQARPLHISLAFRVARNSRVNFSSQRRRRLESSTFCFENFRIIWWKKKRFRSLRSPSSQ